MRVRGLAARFGLAALLALLGQPAAAGLTPKDLSGVGLAPPPGARAPLDAAFTDAADGRGLTLGQALAGRPTLLMPLDYACRNVCDPMLSLAGTALAATGLVPGTDFKLVTLGFNPRAPAATARAMVTEQLGQGPLLASAVVLTGAPGPVEAVTRAVGYAYAYDRDTESYAHPAGALVLAGDGRVARVLSPLAMTARDLRLALVEAGEGRVGGLADRLVLLCYGYDPQTGIYTPLIRRILAASGLATVLGIGLLVLGLHRRSRRDHPV
ncbi:electron transporter [Methylobacterium sp. SyP6R]|uniref:electron transporter n=1 Tax=Methylobacterium sp. SyP6R TaxID=2718876 RepID=UPI001F3560B4|nr:electron transporter [Methylobacterium sp. SyP6R]MCF4125749.1 electron transporter [Methylobacterium sp. SyP6R]